MIFDSGLGALKLPILRSVNFEEEGEETPSEARHRGTLSVLLERYMEWKVQFPEGALGLGTESRTFRLTVCAFWSRQRCSGERRRS